MSKQNFASKLANVPIAKLKNPYGGIFAGRNIPKDKLEDPDWLRVLELKKPPTDGLYIPRESLKIKSQKKPVKEKGLLYGIAKSMVDYEQAQQPRSQQGKRPVDSAPRVVRKTTSPYSVPRVDDWNTLSPDIESTYLGLEQLEHGESISIIGAGITGLTLAWILNRSRPDLHIKIYDKNPDVGGWMCSKEVDLPDNFGKTLFESGPRTLLPSHPGSEILTRLLYEIGRRDELMSGVPQKSLTNRKGLICNGEVQQLPNSLGETLKFMLASPLLKGARWKALKDLWNPTRNANIDDESVRSFMTRRIGAPLADRMISAVMRGIYAADVDKLSARSVARLSRLYYLERTENMSVLAAMFSGTLGYLDQYAKEALPLAFDALAPTKTAAKPEDRHLTNREHPVSKFSMYGFKGGIQNMARAIADNLRTRKNVEINLNADVQSIENDTARTVKIELGDGSTAKTNVAVSTIARPSMFAKANEKLAEDIQKVKYSSLAVVNVWVPDAKAAKNWFGILVPKTEDEWNTNKVLGVIFDSSVRNATKEDVNQHEKGSNMTVMMGGDLWNEGMSVEEAKNNALNGLIQMKLLDPKTTLDDTIMQVALQRNAIPLYEVGHSQLQHRVMQTLADTYNNRVGLIGMAFGRGCGVSDCAIDAMTVALRFSEQRKLLHPEFFFNHWWSQTRPEYYA